VAEYWAVTWKVRVLLAPPLAPLVTVPSTVAVTMPIPKVSDARRAAWAWRRYVTAIRSARTPVIEIRYEQLAREPAQERFRPRFG